MQVIKTVPLIHPNDWATILHHHGGATILKVESVSNVSHNGLDVKFQHGATFHIGRDGKTHQHLGGSHGDLFDLDRGGLPIHTLLGDEPFITQRGTRVHFYIDVDGKVSVHTTTPDLLSPAGSRLKWHKDCMSEVLINFTGDVLTVPKGVKASVVRIDISHATKDE